MINQALSDYGVENNLYFEIKDGEVKIVTFLNAEIVVSPFQNGNKKTVKYTFLVDGKEKQWHRQSKQLANQMSALEKEDVISIERCGKNNDTTYDVKIVK